MLEDRPGPKAKDTEGKKTSFQVGMGHIWKFLLKSLVQGFSDNHLHRTTRDFVKMQTTIQQFWVGPEILHF